VLVASEAWNVTLSDGAEAAEGLVLNIEARGRMCTQGGNTYMRHSHATPTLDTHTPKHNI
jgi:hypothetical protein